MPFFTSSEQKGNTVPSGRTIRRTNKLINRLAETFRTEFQKAPGPVLLRRTGEIIRTTWGNTMVEQVWQGIPRTTRQKFLTDTQAIEPTEKEWKQFERKLFVAARRAAIRQVRQRFDKVLGKLPKPIQKGERGRPKRDLRKAEIIRETIEKWRASGKCKTKSEAVEKACKLFGGKKTPLHPDTIWRYLRAASHASRPRPRSAILNVARPSGPRSRDTKPQ